MDFTFEDKLDFQILFNKANNLEVTIETARDEDIRAVTITLRDHLTGKVYGWTGEVNPDVSGLCVQLGQISGPVQMMGKPERVDVSVADDTGVVKVPFEPEDGEDLDEEFGIMSMEDGEEV